MGAGESAEFPTSVKEVVAMFGLRSADHAREVVTLVARVPGDKARHNILGSVIQVMLQP
jgi:hypothetical protein